MATAAPDRSLLNLSTATLDAIAARCSAGSPTPACDQIARLCIDGTAKFPTYLVPTIVHHIGHGGPIRHAALALAGWARYLATIPVDRQAPDQSGDLSRRYAREAIDEPGRFLDLDVVFTSALRESARFRAEFEAPAAALTSAGPLAAMAACGDAS
jgi:mannitol 2-dehydrogenase